MFTKIIKMGKNIKIAILLCFIQIAIISSLNDYFEMLTIDYSLINTVNTTVVISQSIDMGPCTCDLTPNTCDYHCCCDTDCPSSITTIWLNDPNDICLDKKNQENNYLTTCFNEAYLYQFNRKRGMAEYRDPVSNLFCVTFDNSSVMGQFYTTMQNLAASTLNTIYQNYVNFQLSSYYYYNMNTGAVVNQASFQVDDYLRAKLTSSSNLILDGKFLTYQSGAYGECIKTNAVKFMRPNEQVSCGFRLKALNSCANYSWDQLVSFSYSFANIPSASPTYIPIVLNNVLTRDYETEILTVGKANNLAATTLTQIGTTCICDNMLEEANYIFVIDPNLMVINAVYLDLILATNVQGNCNNKFIMDQSYSTKFLNSLSDNIGRSGSPGYLIGYKLLIGYNSTAANGSIFFEVPDEGLYMTGRQQDNTCTSLETPSNFKVVESIFDSPINYGVNTLYSCNLNFNLTQFQNFCTNKNWKNLAIYNLATYIQYIGIFGNANIEFSNDWTQTIFDYNLNASNWTAEQRICNFPNTIVLDVLTSKAGAINNPQEYVVSARVSAKYKPVSFTSNDSSETLPFTISFITNFVTLTEDIVNIARNFPTF